MSKAIERAAAQQHAQAALVKAASKAVLSLSHCQREHGDDPLYQEIHDELSALLFFTGHQHAEASRENGSAQAALSDDVIRMLASSSGEIDGDDAEWSFTDAALIAFAHNLATCHLAPAVSDVARVDVTASFEKWAKAKGLICESHGIRSESSMSGLALEAWEAALATRHISPVAAAVAQRDLDAAFAQFCDREGYPSDGPFDASLRKAFDAGHASQPPADAAPVDADKLRAQGRAEALAILMGLSAEGGIDAYTGWSKPVGPEDEGDAYWDEPKLRELFAVDGTLANMMNKAEAEHCQYLGMQQEAEHAKNFAANMHNSGKVRDVLAKAGEFGLIADLCRDAQPSTAQGDALSPQSAPTTQQERAWYKDWLAGLDGNITLDQIEFGRRVWAERARRAVEGGAG